MKFIDLTHTFSSNMPVYPGDPRPELQKIADLETHGYNDHQIKTAMHVGTHIDAPLHMVKNGKLLSEFPVEQFFSTGCLVDARNKPIISAELLQDLIIERGDMVLVLTGFSKYFGQDSYYEKYPEMSEDFARKLIDLGVTMVGFDMPSPDRPPFAIHKLLLGKEILIIENLTNLEALVGYKILEIVALPAKFETDAAPARVVARVN
jgi:kynurenine formamidase